MARDLDDPAVVLAAPLTLSDKIRRLAAAGYSRRQIADLVNRSYQQVRQVLVEDERRARRAGQELQGVSEAPAAPLARPASPGIYRLAFSADGDLALPEELEGALGLHRGGVAVAELDGDGLRIMTSSAALERAQAFVRSLAIPKGVSLADELIADRRREAEQEDRDG